jgi:hypothetical protein
MKFAEGIINSVKFQTAEYIIHFQAMHWTREHHFEATKQLV